MAYKYPDSDFDKPDALLALLGSFWANTYNGSTVALSQAAATAQSYAQAQLDLLEAAAALSRADIPVFHTEHWELLTFRESEVNGGTYGLPKFGDGDPIETGSTLRFGVPVFKPFYAWPVPAELADVRVLTNRITGPSLTLTKNVDFKLVDGYLVLRTNPFDDPRVPKRTLLAADGTVADRECGLWAFRGQYDRNFVYAQFGYALALKYPSSESYKQLINAVLDSLVLGSGGTDFRLAWSAVTGVPLAQDDETVEEIVNEADRKLVITDQHVYAYSAAATVIVTAGQNVHKHDPLTDTLVFYEFNRGQVPDVPALAVGRGMLAAGYFQDLVFENKDVAMVVTTDADGFTKVSWQLGGFPGDVERFFDELHARGVATGQTMAHLLDKRPAASREGEPSAASLPTTINPMAFLCQNILRNNAFLVVVRPGAFGAGALGLDAAKILRKTVPPQTAMLVLAELEYSDMPIRMEAAGNDTTPGYEEEAAIYLGMATSETVSPGMVAETVRLRRIGGHCI